MPRRSTVIDAPRVSSPQRRARFIAIGVVVWMLAVGARLVQLQVNQHEELASRARSPQVGAIETSRSRGQLLDRQGRELARSIDTESFFADPREIPSTEDTARRIAAITGQDRAELTSRLSEAKESSKKFLGIVGRLYIQSPRKFDQLNPDGIYSSNGPKRY